MVYAVQGQGHGLQGTQIAEGPDRDLGECVVVQPQVAEGGQPLEAPVRDQGDEVGIKAPGGERGGSVLCQCSLRRLGMRDPGVRLGSKPHLLALSALRSRR